MMSPHLTYNLLIWPWNSMCIKSDPWFFFFSLCHRRNTNYTLEDRRQYCTKIKLTSYSNVAFQMVQKCKTSVISFIGKYKVYDLYFYKNIEMSFWKKNAINVYFVHLRKCFLKLFSRVFPTTVVPYPPPPPHKKTLNKKQNKHTN